jgi:hypothetical protein
MKIKKSKNQTNKATNIARIVDVGNSHEIRQIHYPVLRDEVLPDIHDNQAQGIISSLNE